MYVKVLQTKWEKQVIIASGFCSLFLKNRNEQGKQMEMYAVTVGTDYLIRAFNM